MYTRRGNNYINAKILLCGGRAILERTAVALSLTRLIQPAIDLMEYNGLWLAHGGGKVWRQLWR